VITNLYAASERPGAEEGFKEVLVITNE